MEKTLFFQSTFSKWEKILDKLPHRSLFKSDRDEKNLDNEKNEAGSSENNQNPVKEDDKHSEEKEKEPENEANVRQSGVEINQGDALQFNKYEKVDDLINGAIENIQEASAALANLAGSHEHELKMIIMKILAKFQDWIDGIQKKLNSTKKTLNDLKWILATKDIELNVKDREVNELRQSITEYEKKLKTHEEAIKHPEVSNLLDLIPSNPVLMKPSGFKGCSSDFPISSSLQNVSAAPVTHVTKISLSSLLKISSDHRTSPEFVTAEHSLVLSVAKTTNALKMPIGPKSSEHEVEVNEIAIEDENPENKNVSIIQPQKSQTSHPKVPVALANMSASRTIVSNLSTGSFDHQTILLDISSMEVGNGSAKLTRPSFRHELPDGIKEASSRPLFRIPEQKSSLTQADSSKEDKNDSQETKSEIARTLDEEENLSDISALRMSILRASVNNENQTSHHSIRNSDTSVIFEQRLSSQTNLEVPVTEKPVIINITHQRSPDNFDFFRQSVTLDREKREEKLKEKLSEVRRENEKLKKDKLKYENTLKKALFHGFMALIKEEKLSTPKKRITKICYTPCVPCSTVASSANKKPSVPDLKITENLTPQESRETQSNKQIYQNTHPCPSKQSSQNTFCSSKQKSRNPGAKIPELYIQAQSISPGVQSICRGGKCCRAAYYNRNLVKNIDRSKCCAKTSKFQSHMHKNSANGFNISPAGLQEYTRVMGCKNVLTPLQRPGGWKRD